MDGGPEVSAAGFIERENAEYSTAMASGKTPGVKHPGTPGRKNSVQNHTAVQRDNAAG
jgi:hypothetical protein